MIDEQRIEDDPWGLVGEALLCSAKGEPCPDDLGDAVSIVAATQVAAMLRSYGMPDDKIEDLFVERSWEVKLKYVLDSEELSIEIVWDDGTSVSANGTPEK